MVLVSTAWVVLGAPYWALGVWSTLDPIGGALGGTGASEGALGHGLGDFGGCPLDPMGFGGLWGTVWGGFGGSLLGLGGLECSGPYGGGLWGTFWGALGAAH